MENNNKKSTAIIIAVIIIVLIGGGFYFSYKKRSVNDGSVTEQVPLKGENGSKYEITSINAKHQYKNGKHIYVGMIDLPTPCHTVSVEAVSGGDNKFTLQFTTKTTDELCAQIITPRPFRVEFAGPKVVVVDATLNGEAITLNVLEIKEGQDIDKVDFNFNDKS